MKLPLSNTEKILNALVVFLRSLFSKLVIVNEEVLDKAELIIEKQEEKAKDIAFPEPTKKSFLICPIQGMDINGKPLTSCTVRVSSILDHSGTAIDPGSKNRWGKNAKNQKVKAFNGEIGDGEPSAEVPYGYTKKTLAPFFSSNEINYVGAAGNGDKYGPTYYLNYDGHAGYDFSYPKLTSIVAPASGQLRKAAPGDDLTYGANWNTDHSFYIKHDNGYITWFRHCEKLNDDIETQILGDFSKECFVEKGKVIAYVGKVGTGSVHLHFEVLDDRKIIVDPYEKQLWEA
jgi:murein DD-endopeptidase MepM/ murein hydrolase activator NlpD